MLQLNQRSDCEVAVVGAGPYGLSVAAHLRGARIDTHVFGEAMSFWRSHMPKGMRLRSSLSATDLGDPKGELSLDAYAKNKGITLTYPVPRDDFVDYGEWFQSQAVADLDPRKVSRIESTGDHFSLFLEGGDRMVAQRVVLATGLANHEFRPEEFSGLPTDLVSHTCEHDDLTKFHGQRVAVIGRGQSACESAALLNDAGAEVELISRGDIRWLGIEAPDADQGTNLLWRSRDLVASKSGVGPFPLSWLVEFPALVRRMPTAARGWFNSRCLRAGAASWLKPRFDGVTAAPGRRTVGARVTGSQVSLQFDSGSSTFDHVLLATGYHVDIARLGIFAPELLGHIRCAKGSPILSTGLESSVPGLHFVGASSVESYGPLMRFVAGSGYAARHLTKAVNSKRSMLRDTAIKGAHKPVFAQRQ
jgi:hypothetical protein